MTTTEMTETDKYNEALDEWHRLFDLVQFLGSKGATFSTDTPDHIMQFLGVDTDKVAQEAAASGTEAPVILRLIRGGA